MFSFTYRRLRRRPAFWWLCVFAAAALAGILVSTSVANAQASAARFDGLTPVFVATRTIEAGEVIEAEMIEDESWPKAFLPESPIETDPVGKPARVPIAKGEPITHHRLAPIASGQAAAQLQPRESGIAIPAGDFLPAMQPGDLVDVLVTMETPADSFEPTNVVAPRARVLHITETAVTIAVKDVEASRVAFALARGEVLLALSAP